MQNPTTDKKSTLPTKSQLRWLWEKNNENIKSSYVNAPDNALRNGGGGCRYAHFRRR
jgi:hypothetical protein